MQPAVATQDTELSAASGCPTRASLGIGALVEDQTPLTSLSMSPSGDLFALSKCPTATQLPTDVQVTDSSAFVLGCLVAPVGSGAFTEAHTPALSTSSNGWL